MTVTKSKNSLSHFTKFSYVLTSNHKKRQSSEPFIDPIHTLYRTHTHFPYGLEYNLFKQEEHHKTKINIENTFRKFKVQNFHGFSLVVKWSNINDKTYLLHLSIEHIHAMPFYFFIKKRNFFLLIFPLHFILHEVSYTYTPGHT